MAVPTSEWIKWGIAFLLLCFHVSVTIFIFFKVTHKSPEGSYKSPFFRLYLMVSFMDIIAELNTFFGLRIILFDSLKKAFLQDTVWISISYLLSAYLIYSQCFIHAAIAINRAWCAFMLTTKKVRLEKIGKNLIWILPFLPWILLAYRFVDPRAIYTLKPDGELSTKIINATMQQYQSTCGPAVVFSTSLISFFLELATIYRYRCIIKNSTTLSASVIQDIRLFAQAFIVLIIQLLFVIYYVLIFLATINSLPQLQLIAVMAYPWLNDFLSLCNPVALFIVSKNIRQDFLKFYKLRTYHSLSFIQIGPSMPSGSNEKF